MQHIFLFSAPCRGRKRGRIMQRIIPTHYVHTRSTAVNKETAPASIWKRHLDGHPAGVTTTVGDAARYAIWATLMRPA